MSQFATQHETYARVNLREDEYESMLAAFLPIENNSWRWAPWKPTLEGPCGRSRPDAVMVADDFSRWCVVEVELVSHPEDHFRSQFERIEAAHYGRHLAGGVANALGIPMDQRLEQLLRREFPELVCIADGGSDALSMACRDFGFKLAIGTPYRSDLGNWAIHWTRLPAVLNAPPSAIEFRVVRSDERWGGKYFIELPTNFPQLRSIRLRVDGTEYEAAIYDIAGRRRVLLPESVDPSPRDLLRLRPIDPVRDLYELLNGVPQP